MLVMSCPSSANEPESCCSSSDGSSCTSSSIPTSDTSSMSGHAHSHHAPPPPPLPPPPPPGAPPPPPSNFGGHRKKRRVRSFFWKPIPEEKVREKPNIWTLAARQQQFQIDVRSVEELFGQQEDAGAGGRRTTTLPGESTHVSRSRSFKESSKDEVSILDSKRGMNVGIFLKQFKRSNISIVEDIRRGDGKIYGAELMKDLLKLLPDAEEIKKLRAFQGDPDKLALVDSFMFLLIQVPRFEVRIEAMVLREEFAPSCSVMSREIDVIRVATKELIDCEELHAVLHLVLQAGNIMNAGGYAGNAVGFKLSSLPSLVDTKANKPGMNLLHFVAMEAKKKDETLLKFPDKLHHVQSAARISVENVEAEFSSLYVRIRTLEEKIQGDPDLLLQLKPFLQTSAQTLQDLKRRRLDLRKEGNTLIDFFCEDKDTFKLDECFRIFQDFCIKFRKAVKDNVERELKEAARQRRLRELEEKRFSWSGAESSGFGRSSSENDVDSLTKEGLLDFLQQRSQSPASPLGRSASARRHRHTMTSIADRDLQGYLQCFGENPSEGSKFNSLPRSGRAPERRSSPWILDNNRELGNQRIVMSPNADTEPISPLARFSSPGLKTHEDGLNNNNNNCLSVSEGSPLPHYCVFQKTDRTVSRHMNVSLEKHTLAPVPQAFGPASPNTVNQTHSLKRGDLILTDLEASPSPRMLEIAPGGEVLEKLSDPKKAWELKPETQSQTENFPSGEKEEEEEDSTFSSTSCDTPLPLDASDKKPTLYIIDCTETDCSVMLDYSEVESSSAANEGLPVGSDKDQDPGSPSSTLESSNEPSPSAGETPRSSDAATMTRSEEWDAESCEGKPRGKRDTSRRSESRYAKSEEGGSVRTLRSSERQGLRRVVPISRGPPRKPAEKPAAYDTGSLRRPPRDQSIPARGRSEKRPPRHSSLPPDESKALRGVMGTISKFARDLTPRKVSGPKPSAKPLRNFTKPPPEEKMCRSTMRALTRGGASPENGDPQTARNADVPGFLRNTVASSSRTRKDLDPTSVPSTPARSPSLLGRQSSAKQSRVSSAEQASDERPRATSLRRAASVKARRSETPTPHASQDDVRKTGGGAEKTANKRDSTPCNRSSKPTWR